MPPSVQRSSPGLHAAKAPPVRRRRSAQGVVHTSDVTRFRGALAGVVFAFIVVAGGLILFLEPAAERLPGPLSRPHVRAQLECASCHGKDGEGAPKEACAGCHGPHAAVRPAHARLRTAGVLGCVDCHRVHRDLGGVAFEGGGRAWRFGPGAEVEVEVPPSVGAGVVAVVPVEACGRCHAPSDPKDPIARCLIEGQASLGAARPTVCFDEHRPWVGAELGRGGDAGERRVLWAATRHALATTPVPPPSPPPVEGGLWLGIVAAAVFTAVVAMTLIRTVRGAARAEAEAGALIPPQRRRLPVINAATCIGCSACVDACPYDVLILEQYVAKLAAPDDCCGLTLCEQKCPNGSLVVTDGEVAAEQPRIDATLQSLDQPGLYIAGDLTGLPLIRNAINQGAAAVRSLAETLEKRRTGDLLDLVIVGAGPAGLSAALQATDLGLSYLVLEQGSVAQSIRSFPRGKLVFDQPLGVPRVGDLWLAESTKEELLGKWLRIVRTHALQIAEGRRVATVEVAGGGQVESGFVVGADCDGVAETYPCRRVLLALGKRGTPRSLPIDIPDAAVDHVHYSLADARSFAGKRVLVVGLGDVAMETAVALAGQRGTDVTVAYRGPTFSRGKRRNIEELQRLVRTGRVTLRLQTTVSRIEPGRVELVGPARSEPIDCDAVFVMIGGIAPWEFLRAAGVKRVKDAWPSTPGAAGADTFAAPVDPTAP